MKKAILLSLSISLLAGCAMTGHLKPEDVKKRLIGHTKESILACMGAPLKKSTQNSTELWEYKSGDGIERYTHNTSALEVNAGVSMAGATGKIKSHTNQYTHIRKRSCSINILFKDSKVVDVNHFPLRDKLLAPSEQCSYAFKNC